MPWATKPRKNDESNFNESKKRITHERIEKHGALTMSVEWLKRIKRFVVFKCANLYPINVRKTRICQMRVRLFCYFFQIDNSISNQQFFSLACVASDRFDAANNVNSRQKHNWLIRSPLRLDKHHSAANWNPKREMRVKRDFRLYVCICVCAGMWTKLRSFAGSCMYSDNVFVLPDGYRSAKLDIFSFFVSQFVLL